jgi:hypothetical protein
VTFGTACEIPASILRALPWGLSQGADIKAKVVAVNSLGDSSFSSSGSGAKMPSIPDEPTFITRI